ncbi:MAG: hypothetical protein K9G64_03630 [Bacteroidia bacterium]|nr:hypothetical protein [Bacteroidia bacterium]
MNQENNIVNSNRIIISTLEEQEDDMRKYWASITPIQRLIHLNELIKISFGLKTQTTVFSNRINFEKV